MSIRLIVGLANPGFKYSKTRHNVGSWYIQSLSKFFNFKLNYQIKTSSYMNFLKINNEKIYILIPKNFINMNGEIILKIINTYKINFNEILVAHDELDLLPGIVKLQSECKHSTHNGLRSILKYFKNKKDSINCLRIGIGHPGKKEQVTNYVLNEPLENESNLINYAINKAVKYTEIIITKGIVFAMNFINKKI